MMPESLNGPRPEPKVFVVGDKIYIRWDGYYGSASNEDTRGSINHAQNGETYIVATVDSVQKIQIVVE